MITRLQKKHSVHLGAQCEIFKFKKPVNELYLEEPDDGYTILILLVNYLFYMSLWEGVAPSK